MPGISENPLGDPYILALLNLTENLPSYHAIKAEDMHMEQRAKFVLEQLDPTLRALVNRPKKAKMMEINGIDELGVFCQALRVGWRLWPDCWNGLQMLVDYLAFETLLEDILKIDSETLDTLNLIIRNERWRNVMVGKGIIRTAQSIVVKFIPDPVFAEIRAEINEEMTSLEKNILILKDKLAPRNLNDQKRVKLTKMLWVAEHKLVGLKNELLELQKRQL